MINLKSLKQFGLHYKDIKVYQAVLILGRAKSGALIKKSGLGSSSFYTSISLLIEKGLVSFEVKNNVRYYKPEPMESLIEQSRETTRNLQTISMALAKLKPPTGISRTDVDVLEGYHGLERAFLDHVEHFRKGAVIRIIGFGSQAPQRKSLDNFLNKINYIANKKQCKMIILLDKNLKNHRSPTQILKNKRIHYLPTPYFGPMAYNITETEVMLSLWGKKPTVVRLRNPIMVRGFISNFDFLVTHAKK
ncbi:MAG: helix-turn-helix domain-containing protein [bacterium]|nr:helix-turn-helix domain-containing protein [bacterium]